MRISAAQSSEKPLVFALEGVLDITTVDALEEEIDRYLAEPGARLELDLSRLRMIDSCGVGCLMALGLKVRARGGDVKLRGVFGQPRAIVELLHLEQALRVQDQQTIAAA